MRHWITIAGVVAGALSLGGAFALAAGAFAWQRESARSSGRLRRFGENGASRSERPVRDEVPSPVARYFDFALPDGKLDARFVHIRWRGEFRMRPTAEWVAFGATQDFTVAHPGFVWDASIRTLPLIPVRVRDSYAAGRASMLGRVGGLVTVVEQAGSAELAQSALTRWIGEAVWFPTALLPRQGLRWEAIDDSSARVVVEDGATAASAVFHFAPTGEVVRMSALRYRDVDGTPVLSPFEGVYRDYVRAGEVMVPSKAEVAWLLPEGRYAYWRGQPVEIRSESGGIRSDASGMR